MPIEQSRKKGEQKNWWGERERKRERKRERERERENFTELHVRLLVVL
jgi:hypothetical protein